MSILAALICISAPLTHVVRPLGACEISALASTVILIARAVDTYASIAWHPDVEDVWLEGNFMISGQDAQ